MSSPTGTKSAFTDVSNRGWVDVPGRADAADAADAGLQQQQQHHEAHMQLLREQHQAQCAWQAQETAAREAQHAAVLALMREQHAATARRNGGPGQQCRSVQPVPGQFYSLQPRHAQHLRLDCTNGGTEAGTRIQLWGANGTPAQRWRLDPRPNGHFCFCSGANDQMALDVPADYAHLVNIDDDNVNQVWRLEDNGDGWFALILKDTNAAYDVMYGATHDGATMGRWPAHGGPNQQWRFVKELD
jgi:hypothetical protein